MDRWTDRLIGAAVAIAIVLGILFGEYFGIWQRIWEWSGLWQYIHFNPMSQEMPASFIPPDSPISITLDAGDTEILGALVNPGFEGIYLPQDGQGPLQLASGWKARWVEGRQGRPGVGVAGSAAENTDWRRPEWKAATLEFPYRVRSGERAQQWFSYSGIHYAGIYQNATVTPSDTVIFSVYGQGWAGSSGDPLTNGDIYVSLGVDPECKEWLESRSVVWTAWMWIPNAKSLNGSLDNWTLFKSYPVKMLKSCATVWVVTTAKWPTQHNDVYFDDAKVWKVAGSTEPCPTPVPCPLPTPCPTPSPSGDCLTKTQFDAGISNILVQIETLLKRLTIELR